MREDAWRTAASALVLELKLKQGRCDVRDELRELCGPCDGEQIGQQREIAEKLERVPWTMYSSSTRSTTRPRPGQSSADA